MNATRKPFRVLFVCMGNICRSPAAEIVFRHQVTQAGLSDAIATDSAGTIGFHAGKGPDPRMAATLKERGYTIFGASRQITAADLDAFDLVLVMDQENLRNVRALDPAGTRHDKIRLFMEYGKRHAATEVPDPYYGGQAGFEHVADLVEDASRGLLRSLS
ncbi:low molecular weight protein-tyrosine-phosphatase [Luteolibacter sp. LG18]|uniref:low molecular weight protein-tyrosine-phosphatase n=1 Tax=Luteolibacter sp. LG18 TaxID=2819286 RepID=UPI002B286517|nr:phosphotyrosine protein phosphatase [Luteolibacter sp. LG18]